MALVSQLREQIAFLELQNKRQQEEKAKDQARIEELNKRIDDTRCQVRSAEMTAEGSVRSLESQLRTCKLEKQDLAIKQSHAERRIRDLEEKALELAASKRKEQPKSRAKPPNASSSGALEENRT